MKDKKATKKSKKRPNMKKRTVRTIHFRVYQKQADIISKIEEEEDLASRLRELINLYGDEKYPETPAYAEALKTRAELKKKEVESKLAFENTTPADYCSGTLGGKVSADGVSCCFVYLNTQVRRVPLTEIKEWKVDDGIPKDHRAIVNKTKTDFNGNLITEDNWKKCMDALAEA